MNRKWKTCLNGFTILSVVLGATLGHAASLKDQIQSIHCHGSVAYSLKTDEKVPFKKLSYTQGSRLTIEFEKDGETKVASYVLMNISKNNGCGTLLGCVMVDGQKDGLNVSKNDFALPHLGRDVDGKVGSELRFGFEGEDFSTSVTCNVTGNGLPAFLKQKK